MIETLGSGQAVASTFSSSFVADLISFAERAGANRKTRLGIVDPDKTSGSRVDAHAMSELWKSAQQMANDPFLAFHMSVEFTYNARRTPFLIMQSCETVRESFQLGVEYGALIADVFAVELGETDDDIFLDYRPKGDWLQAPDTVIDDSLCAAMVSCLNSLQLCVGKFISPSILELQCKPPNRTAQFYDIFNSSICFGTSRNRIGFPANISTMAIATHDNGLLKALRHYGDELKGELLKDGKPAVQVEVQRIILESIAPHTSVTIDSVAREMNVTSRTLQRRLRKHGCSFQHLLDEARRQLAEKYLKVGNKPIDEIGYLLGYSETTSFARAFRRWTGNSPAQYVKRSKSI